jgi:hypothetical protein
MDQDKISNLYRAPAICFLQSFGSFGEAVTEKKRERPFNLKGVRGLWFFSKKNIMIPNVAEKNILILVEEG